MELHENYLELVGEPKAWRCVISTYEHQNAEGWLQRSQVVAKMENADFEYSSRSIEGLNSLHVACTTVGSSGEECSVRFHLLGGVSSSSSSRFEFTGVILEVNEVSEQKWSALEQFGPTTDRRNLLVKVTLAKKNDS